ncbi:threonine synthase [Rhizomicrobium palustre]|uniref:Threonine synthase n=1 Tax=Rhizomicrobium palustre TaxID=189966 RepID=A0A846N228_9PROT|nr:threonine synthase [Rhizomicrobium palustre]NIK89361.1 threonine synthase [Rhizomicrobium palustre]
MRYISTRGQSPAISFADMLLAGLAPDGGLYLPETWPSFTPAEIAAFKGKPYTDVAEAVLGKLIGDSFTPEELRADIAAAYASFDFPAIAPLSEIGRGRYLMELYHGPTLAFKDVALQILGRLFARALKARGGRATVLAATSGDTGSAAIAALGGLENIEVIVLHPKGRVSEVQRRQMTTAPFANVHNIAIEGTFDDGQAIVKALFAETDFAEAVNLTAVNSINFARIAAQAVYYFTAAAELGVAPVFVVPTGNFGDVFAGEAAMRMGLAVEKLVVATNSNDIMARALNEGVYASGKASPTLSPSMDIQVASNFERALFEASGRDSAFVRDAMARFVKDSRLELPPAVLADLRTRYEAKRTDDAATLATIARFERETGRLIDPHTAVALAAAYDANFGEKVPVVVLSTAHPAKFPDAVNHATNRIPELPPRLTAALQGEEKCHVMRAEKALVRGFIEAILRPS